MSVFYQATGAEVDVFKHAVSHRLPVLLKGPTGCGKTRLVEYMADQLDRPLYTVACHDDLTVSDLIGRHLVSHSETWWQDGPLTKAVREGGICYLDEMVEARRDTTVVIHPLTDDRRLLPIDRTGEMLTAHPDFQLVISYNPGYQASFKGLKPSTRQRFVALRLDYPDPKQEAAIVVNESGVALDQAQQLVQMANELRNMKDVYLEESLSTRLIVYAGRMLREGMALQEVITSCYCEALTDQPEDLAAMDDWLKLYCL